MRYSVTGTTRLQGTDEMAIIRDAIQCLEGVTEFSTGGAYGVDSYAAKHAWEIFTPDVLLRGCWPAGEIWNRENVMYVNVDVMTADGYMARNDLLIAHADILLAFPKTKFEEKRSGTWATIRRARKAKVPVWAYPLDGTPRWVENYGD